MTEPLPSVLVRLFFEAMIFGGVLDVAFVLIRAVRTSFFSGEERAEKRQKTAEGVLTAIEDVLFCCFTAVGLLLLAFSGTNGRIRWVLPAGVFLGMLLSRYTVGAGLRRLSGRFSALLRTVRRGLWRVLSSPVRWTARLLWRIASAVLRRLHKSSARRSAECDDRKNE